jgi:hypothetical protein
MSTIKDRGAPPDHESAPLSPRNQQKARSLGLTSTAAAAGHGA